MTAAGQQARPEAAGAPSWTDVQATDPQVFAKQVETLIAGQGELFAGKVHAIGLAKVRERFGAKWPEVSKKAHAIARNAIARHLGDGDLYCLFHEINYLIVFPRLSAEEAQLKALLIAREISRRSGNNIAMEDLVVRTAVTNVGGNLVFKEIDTCNPSPAKEPGTQPDAEDPAGHGERAGFVGLQFLFQPLWNVGSKVLSTYLCLPAWTSDTGKFTTGYDLLIGGAKSRNTLALDLIVLGQVRAQLDKLLASGQKMLLTCPVHINSLVTSSSRAEYFDICRGIPLAARRFMVFELVCGDDELPVSRLHELVPDLDGMSRAVTLRIPALGDALPEMRHLRLHAIGCNLGRRTGPEAKVIEDIDAFAAAAERQQLRTFVHGLGSLSLTTAAVCSGIDYVDGEAITSVVDAPQGVHRFNVEDMFARLLPAT